MNPLDLVSGDAYKKFLRDTFWLRFQMSRPLSDLQAWAYTRRFFVTAAEADIIIATVPFFWYLLCIT